jgi:predicted naringenin-chalcone synthase
LAVANDLVCADPSKNIVLIVCVEARSALSNALPDPTTAIEKIQRNALVQAALFRDGAAATVVGRNTARVSKKNKSHPFSSSDEIELEILDSYTLVVPGTLYDGVCTQELDDNFIKVCTIRTVPTLVAFHAGKLLTKMIATHGICRKDILAFVHPASKAVVEGSAIVTGLTEEQICVSMDCVKTSGNMGGATNLFVMDRWLREEPKLMAKYKYVVGFAPGAGITIQMVLCKIVVNPCSMQEASTAK